MNIHEYQAKELLSQYGVTIPKGYVATSSAEALDAAQKLPGSLWVIKAQIHAGGRGKAGGVRLCKDPASIEKAASDLIGQRLVTPQTGANGQLVRKVYVTEGCTIQEEWYVSLLLDRQTQKLTFVISTQGGMDIETVAKDNPSAILKIAVNFAAGWQPFHERLLRFSLKLSEQRAQKLSELLKKCYRLFIEKDLTLLEINPLIVDESEQLVALDAKITVDDNALYRHPDLRGYYDPNELPLAEQQAQHLDLNYIKLEGTIGCMVNGAGLAMATMDIIQYEGGKPANFLDVGGNADTEKVKAAFQIIVSDPNVTVILINIFGGIMRCDVIAEGIIAAVKETNLSVPVVVRLHGTNSDVGSALLCESGLKIITADNLEDAAQKAVQASKGQ